MVRPGGRETTEELLEELLQVTPERVAAAAKTIRLDTVYFLTGKEDGAHA